jgi:transposase InsO family protein
MESSMVIKLNIITGGMVYMAAIIDWHSKAVLSHRISNTMDSQLVMSVLNDALEKHPQVILAMYFYLGQE